jgi:TatA/E family protein of Tat protein translocase
MKQTTHFALSGFFFIPHPSSFILHPYPMPTFPLVFEFLGTTELLVIALVALIIFGPRKLPEIGRKIGQSLAEFKRASEDFKRTWEYEVETERTQVSTSVEPEAVVPRDSLTAGDEDADFINADTAAGAADPLDEGQTIARGASDADAERHSEVDDDAPSVVESSETPAGKQFS